MDEFPEEQYYRAYDLRKLKETEKLNRQLKERLYNACKQGNLEVVCDLIEQQGINPLGIIRGDALDEGPFFKFAAQSGNVKLAQYLHEIHKADIDSPGTLGGTKDTSLSRAAKKGHLEMVRYLLSKGANPNFKTSYHTVLSEAIIGRSLEIVTLLLDHGCRIQEEDLHYAVEYGRLEIVQLFLARGADLTKPYFCPYILIAVKSGNIALLTYLQKEHGITLDRPSDYDDWKDFTYDLLDASLESKSLSMVKHLVEEHQLDLVSYVQKENNATFDYKHKAWDTLLGEAVIGPVEIVRYIFEDLELAPSIEQIEHLKQQVYQIRMIAYLESYSNEADRTKLLELANSGPESLDPSTLFRFSVREIPHQRGLNDDLRTELQARNLTQDNLISLVNSDPSIGPYLLCYYSHYLFNEDYSRLKFLIEDLKLNPLDPTPEGVLPIKYAKQSGGKNLIC